jgi:ABC-type sugar transport system substrate-binding protein
MTGSSHGRRGVRLAALGAATVSAALLLSACSSGSGGSSTTSAAPSTSDTASASASASSDVDPAALQAVIKQAFLADVPAAELDPLITEALGKATIELTPEQEDIALECWKNNQCDIPGGGDVVVGVADGFGGNAWRKFSKMEIILQALQYPEVGKFIYLDANFDLAKMQANVRSLQASGAKVIVSYNDFGDAMLPTFSQAAKQGVKIATYASPVPGATGDQVTTQVTPNLCDVGKAQADATADLLGSEGGEVAFFNGTPGNPQGQAWNKCAEEQFAAQYPNITVTAKEDTGWTPDGAYKAASALIATGKPIKAILYDYADPMPQIFKAYDQAGKVTPAYVTWTVNNDLNKLWAEEQGGAKAFDLIYTNGTNWTTRVAVTATLKALAGETVNPNVVYPLPFVPADENSWVQDRPGDFVQSLLIPTTLLDKMSAA